LPLCCRADSPAGGNNTRKAQKWGDYNCDIPFRTLKSMFDFIGRNATPHLDIDFITWVGDNSAHDVWMNTPDEVTEYTRNISLTLKAALGNSLVQVFPVTGNHDTWPVNVEDFSKANANYEINHFKDAWRGQFWLSDDEIELFSQYGYYSKPLRLDAHKHDTVPLPNVTVIGMNMNACNDMNWWLVADRSDPGNEIAWLEQELLKIEESKGLAYIIGHIPPSSCLHQFGIRYKALMERFQHVVHFSSWGHSHSEQIFITGAINTTQMIGLNMISGSGTTGGNRNPAFTVIEWDLEFMLPTNTRTFYMNLTQANANPDAEPVWEELHDMVKEYGLFDMSPSSMKNFTERMYQNSTLASQYDWNKDRRGSAKPHTPVHQ